jgi:hypothetical protein
MKIYCLGLVMICLFIYLQIDQKKEGFTVPDRVIPDSLSNVIKGSPSGSLGYTKSQTDLFKKETEIEKKYKPRQNVTAFSAKANRKECKDTNKYHSCKIEPHKAKALDPRYIHLASDKISPSSIYTHLSICPQTYQKNMNKLGKQTSSGQYPGYTTNEYIDRTRYIDITEPIPVNPDFFVKGGGTFA